MGRRLIGILFAIMLCCAMQSGSVVFNISAVEASESYCLKAGGVASDFCFTDAMSSHYRDIAEANSRFSAPSTSGSLSVPLKHLKNNCRGEVYTLNDNHFLGYHSFDYQKTSSLLHFGKDYYVYTLRKIVI